MSVNKNTFCRNIALCLLLFLLLCLLFLYLCTPLFSAGHKSEFMSAASLPTFQNKKRPVVVLDAGHGGYDSGTQSQSGILEKDLNLKITQKIADFLALFDVDVVLTRTDDTPPQTVQGTNRKRAEILSRAQIAKESEATILLSIHMNAFPQSSCQGAQVFYSERNTQNQVFAHTIQTALRTLLQPQNTREAKHNELIFLLTHVDCTAALLECGFLSNEEETRLFCDETYQNQFAFVTASAIISHLNQH